VSVQPAALTNLHTSGRLVSVCFCGTRLSTSASSSSDKLSRLAIDSDQVIVRQAELAQREVCAAHSGTLRKCDSWD
jgi:hypothetical protein